MYYLIKTFFVANLNKNAENIDEEGRSENDESDLDEENEKDFIVPDGYVSADEKPEGEERR